MTNTPAPILVISMPKAGTHLLTRVLMRLPGLKNTDFQIGRPHLQKFLADSTDGTVPGQDWGLRFPEHSQAVRTLLAMIQPGQFSTTHLAPDPHFVSLLRDQGLTLILMIRDPRDVVVSHAHYISNNDEHPLHGYYRNMDWEQRVTTSITGCSSVQTGTRGLKPMATRFKAFMSWMEYRNILCVRFEELVGASGGGSDAAQRKTIKNIGAHAGVPLDTRQLCFIAENLFGDSATFRRGMIGGWSSELNRNHKQLINKTMGTLLVEAGYASDLNE